MLSTLARLVIAATFTLTLVACATDDTILSVTITGGDRTLAEGTSVTLTADVLTTGRATTTVTWTSSTPSVAAIDATGTLDALAPGTTLVTATSTTDPTKSDRITVTVVPPGATLWTRQFGSTENDEAGGIASDASGNTYIAGSTLGALVGPNAGSYDAYLRSYDGEGTHRWTRQFGTASMDRAFAVTTDTLGNIYTTGSTRGGLHGESAGGFDGFIRSYDASGAIRWTRQFGTASDDEVFGVSADANDNVYVVGYTAGGLGGPSAGGDDAFIRSYGSDGTLRWTRQFGTGSDDLAWGVAVFADAQIFVVGFTGGALGGPNAGGADGFIRSYDGDGTHRWTRQFGTSSRDEVLAVATDSIGNVYASGLTEGAIEGSHAGAFDGFIRAYAGDGTVRWTRQFGTSASDYALRVAVDTIGNVYAAGLTRGALDSAHAGGADAFLRSYDSGGGLRWTRQFGTASTDYATGVAIDPSGSVYVTGDTTGALVGSNAGFGDAFIRKYGP
jgi:hypothetical protein